jgi:uncharacterized protein (TIGR02231 family)
MKHLFITLSLILSLNSYAENETKLKSAINKVTVYQQGAQIERKAYYNIRKGINELIIEGISSSIDANSIQLKATGNVVILDTKYTIEYPTPEINNNYSNKIPLKIQKEIQLINDSIFEIGYDLLELQYKIDVLNSEKRIIENNGTIKGQGKVNDSIPLLKDALEFYHSQMNKINKDLLLLNRKKILTTKKQNSMQLRLNELNNYNTNNNLTTPPNLDPIHKIVITLSAKETASGKVYVNYLVNNAGWIPLYDLRSNATTSTIDLTYKAQVYQNTGIKWDKVKINLSTNNPYANKTKPELYPWYLNYTQYQNRNQPTSSSIKYKKDLKPQSVNSTKVVDSYDEESIGNEDIYAKNANDFTSMIEQLISVEYSIDLPYTIASDNQKHMVLVNSKTLDTKYKYYSVPKLDLSTYLVAQITDLGELNLIPGNATIFHDGAYLGSTYLNPSTMSDTMNLSLGKDPNILIKRTLLKNESKQKVVGDKIIKTYAYKVELKNHKTSTIKLMLQDQIPISQNTEIEIELINGSKGKLNEITGLIEWNIKLKPKETSTIDLIYSVKYSKSQYIELASN